MTRLVFGDIPATSVGTDWFGYSSYDSGVDYDIVYLTFTDVLVRDPSNLSTVRYQGRFDLSNEQSIVSSPLDSVEWRDGSGALLFQWSSLATTIGELIEHETDPDVMVHLMRNADEIIGGATGETLRGYDGDDVLTGGGGDDTIEGGGGTDTAAWSGQAADFLLSRDAGAFRLTDMKGSEGADTLRDVERLQFADRMVILESRAHGAYDDLPEDLWHFFIVAFDAAPGVTYMDQLAEASRFGMSVKEIVDVFTAKPQFTEVYPAALDHQALAEAMVANIVKDSADAAAKLEAVANIRGSLDGGWSVGDVVYTVFGNLAHKPLDDPQWGGTARQFLNQVEVAKYYTENLSQSTTDLPTLRAVLDPVTPDSDVSGEQALIGIVGQGLLEA